MKRVRPEQISSEGPDWIDLGVMARALQNASKGTVELNIGWPADKYSGPCYVTASHSYPILAGAGKTTVDEVYFTFPNHTNKTIEGLVLQMLMQLDAAYAPNGVQLPLPLEE
jgi:hypothetical protein